MGGDLVPAAPSAAVELVGAAVRAARRPATLRAYAADWRTFAAWCDRKGQPALPAPPWLVAWYLAELAAAGRCYSTIARALASVSVVHGREGFASPRADPLVRDALAGLRNTLLTMPRHAKAALTVRELRSIAATLDGSRRVMQPIRDRAILVFGFAGGFRRSELAALEVADVREVESGLEILIRQSKTDAAGAGRLVGIPFGSDRFTCPVRALLGWLSASGIKEGPIFRQLGPHGDRRDPMSPRAIGEVVKRAVRLAGLDPAKYGGHSLRAGLCTAAAQAGKSAAAIMAQTGHKSAAIVMRYVRAAGLFDDNAAAGIGL